MTGTGTFTEHIKEFAKEVHQNAKDHGCHGFTDERYIVLMHSELSEMVEALRDGDPTSEKIPQFSHMEEELADLFIRVLDFSAAREFDIAGAVVAKAEFNKSRPFKHGRVW